MPPGMLYCRGFRSGTTANVIISVQGLFGNTVCRYKEIVDAGWRNIDYSASSSSLFLLPKILILSLNAYCLSIFFRLSFPLPPLVMLMTIFLTKPRFVRNKGPTFAGGGYHEFEFVHKNLGPIQVRL